MSYHTPGPWEFDGVCQIVEVERPHMRVCFLPSDHAEYESSKANGRLISAAPDMLAVLNAARIVLKNRDQRPEEARLLDAIKIAIAKAEGSHPPQMETK